MIFSVPFPLILFSFLCRFSTKCSYASSVIKNDVFNDISTKNVNVTKNKDKGLKGNSSDNNILSKKLMTTFLGTPEILTLCPSCRTRDSYQNYTINEIKNHILKNLGMYDGPPKYFRKGIDNNLVEQVFGERQNAYSNLLNNPKNESNNEFEDNDSNIILASFRKLYKPYVVD